MLEEKEQIRSMNSIRSIKHNMFSETVIKVALSPNDGKRIIMPNKIDTLAYGHYMEKFMEKWENGVV